MRDKKNKQTKAHTNKSHQHTLVVAPPDTVDSPFIFLSYSPSSADLTHMVSWLLLTLNKNHPKALKIYIEGGPPICIQISDSSY
jgi:hypothetical protein